MKTNSIQVTHYHGAPESFRREVEAQIRFAEGIASDISLVSNLIKAAFSKIANVAETLRNNGGNQKAA